MFEIGDRVIGRGIMDGENIDGLVGTVVLLGYEYDASLIGVRFDESRYTFHTLEYTVEEGYGFWVSQSKLERVGPKRERKRRGFATFVRKIENTVDNVS